MPVLNFLNRNNKAAANNNDGAATAAAAENKKASAMNAVLLHLPPEQCRRVVRDRVMTSAAAVYIRLGVDASLVMDEDPDLSKDAKVKKRDEQYAAHQAHKDRLQSVLGNDTLFPIVNTCLLLDAKGDDSAPFKKNVHTTLSLHDAFACVTLLLCNFVLLAASGIDAKDNPDNNKSSNGNSTAATEGGYDARIRNVLRMASVELLTEALKAEDTDGSFLRRLEDKQQSRPNVSVDEEDLAVLAVAEVAGGSGGEGKEESTSLSMEKQMSQAFEQANIQKNEDAAEMDDEKKAGAEATTTGLTAEEAAKDVFYSKVFHDLYRRYSTRKYQVLEKAVADLIMNQTVNKASSSSEKLQDVKNDPADEGEATKSGRFSRKQLVRAAKIGGVGVVAGTLFAVTGGLAAPGIAAGLAALGVGGTALTLAASPVALIALFGAGGGGLSAYKMKRRTDGLSEFNIQQETIVSPAAAGSNDTATTINADLHTTVCVSGWLKDEHDFQRPWGVMPNNLSRLERLERFFSVVDSDKVQHAKAMMEPYSKKGEDPAKDEELWEALTMALKEQYGKSPDELLPLEDRAMTLSVEEDAALQEIVNTILQAEESSSNNTASRIKSSTITVPVLSEDGPPASSRESLQDVEPSDSDKKAKEQSTFRVWDYQTEYGGDVYTIQWESAMLLNMCQVANNMVKQLANKATSEVLKKTVLATMMAAVALPSLLMGLAGSLDNDWTLITIRSDLAGLELARSLLQSNERRPVTLVGFSFGARIIYACLLELARHQGIWEEQQQDKKDGTFKKKWKNKKPDEDSWEYTREPASIVQDALMIGAPIFVSRSKLRLARHMVAGRFVNCYSRKDWILSLMFQYQNTSGILRGTCGTGPINGVGGIENYDVSGVVSSWHARYCHTIPDILDLVGFDQPMPTEIKVE